MKKLFFALTLLLAMAVACAALADGPNAFDNVAYVNNPNPADRLNLRAKPSASAVSLGKYYNGTSVTILGDAGNGYLHVRIDPLEGYMDAAYLTRNMANVTFAMPTLVVSDPSGAAVRSQPSHSAKVLYTYGYNSSVFNVLSVRADGWLHIAGSGERGFIRADQLIPQLSYHQTLSGAPVANSAFVNNPNPADRLNLRAEPRASAVSLGKYYNGVEVLVLGDAGNGYWRVRVNSLEGYMDAAYLSTKAVASAQPVVRVRNAGGNGVNVRYTPSSNARYEYTAQNGEELTVLGVRDDGWLHVQYYGVIGFVRGELVTPQLSYHQDPGGAPVANSAFVNNPDPADRLHLRTEPRASAVSLGKYYNGVEVLVLGDAGNGYWRVRVNSLEGYMDAAYLSTKAVASAQPVVRVRNAGGAGANVRYAPSSNARYEYTAQNGEELTVLGVRADGWLHVQYYGVIGFVRGELVTPEVTFDK